MVPDTPRRVDLQPGVRLGRWVLERVIGQGATATVWAARHERLGSPVAIKVFIRQGLAFHDVLGEARAAAGIPSPFAIWVYDVDTWDGHHAIVMELCGTGEAVAEALRLRPDRAPQEAARIVAQAARGVAAAHAGGVFHKDVKPANILIHPTDGRAQITDFGLANPALWRVAARERHVAQSTVSVDAMVEAPARAVDPHRHIRGPVRVGTPEYMAPEQAEGLRGDFDPREPAFQRYLTAIDVYGLGATLYALVVGQPPFPHGPLAEQHPNAEQIMQQVVDGPPPRLRDLRRDLPKRLVAIIERAMARDPLDRYDSAYALADDLDAFLLDQPTSLDRTALQRLGVHLWRERVRVGGMTLLLALAAVTTLVIGRNMQMIYNQRQELAAQRTELDRLGVTQRELSVELRQAQLSLARARTDLNQQAGQLSEAERELEERNGALERLAGQLDAQTQDLAATSVELDEAASRALDLERERDMQSSLIEELRLQLSDTLHKLTAAEDDLSGTRALLVDEAARGSELERQLYISTTQLDAERKAAADALREARALREEAAQLRLQIESLTEALRQRALESPLLQDAPAP